MSTLPPQIETVSNVQDDGLAEKKPDEERKMGWKEERDGKARGGMAGRTKAWSSCGGKGALAGIPLSAEER